LINKEGQTILEAGHFSQQGDGSDKKEVELEDGERIIGLKSMLK
jgi:hypothetical protein